MGLTASFLLLSCHSGKKATKSKYSATHTTEKNYVSEPGNPPNNSNQRKSKRSATNEPALQQNAIAEEYASKLGVSTNDITNYKLYNFISTWYGTPYKFAGRSRAGVDCTDLVSLLFQSIYGITLSGNVTDMYRRCKPITPSELREGDLIFFKINSKSLSHIAIYLQNHKFVHASVHSGVVIDDLGEDYYKRYFWGAGRVVK